MMLPTILSQAQSSTCKRKSHTARVNINQVFHDLMLFMVARLSNDAKNALLCYISKCVTTYLIEGCLLFVLRSMRQLAHGEAENLEDGQGYPVAQVLPSINFSK